MKKQTIGFIGTGVMGKSLARHLHQSGYSVHVYTRTKKKANDLLDQGLIWSETVKELAEKCDVIISMVGYPSDVKEVYFGPKGILENAKAGSFVIDMTTSKPKLAEDIYKEAKKKHIHSLDAPVSGGDVGARDATLAIMIGGDQETFDQMKPILNILGSKITLHGKAGAGQHIKMCNQIGNALNMIGVCESILYAKRAGLDPLQMIETVKSGAASSWTLANLGPRMLQGDFAPGFYVKHFIKDIKIALESSKEMNIHLPGLSLALELYEELSNMGEDDSGTQALLKYYEQ